MTTIKYLVAISFVAVLAATGAAAQTLCPDGSYVGGGQCTLAPDGTYVGGDDYTMTPDGGYVGGDTYTLTPDGSTFPGVRSRTRGLPFASQTAWSLVLRPPLVRPMMGQGPPFPPPAQR